MQSEKTEQKNSFSNTNSSVDEQKKQDRDSTFPFYDNRDYNGKTKYHFLSSIIDQNPLHENSSKKRKLSSHRFRSILLKYNDQSSEATEDLHEMFPTKTSLNTMHNLKLKQKITLQCIDEIITNLSDKSFFSPIKELRSQRQTIKKIDYNFNNEKKIKTNDWHRHYKKSGLIGLESEYRELRYILSQSLLSRKKDSSSSSLINKTKNKNVAILLMGPRGHGKRSLLETALTSIQDEAYEYNQSLALEQKIRKKEHKAKKQQFRIIRVNGLLLQNGNDELAFREIFRQLTEIGTEETCDRATASAHINIQKQQNNHFHEQHTSFNTNRNGIDFTHNTKQEIQTNRENNMEIDNNLINQKTTKLFRPTAIAITSKYQSQFHSNLTSLDDAFQRAQIDSIPILVVLYELDTFVASTSSSSSGASNGGISNSSSNYSSGTGAAAFNNTHSEKQILLYHLLDRVSSYNSNVSIVGLTTRLTTLEMFERRVKSRAQGNLYTIYCGHPSNMNMMFTILFNKFTIKSKNNAEIGKPSQKEESKGTNEGNKTGSDIEKKNDTVSFGNNGDRNIAKLEEGYEACKENEDKWKVAVLSKLQRELQKVFGFEIKDNCKVELTDEEDEISNLRAVFTKHFNMGKDVRWFCHVLIIALSLVVVDYKLLLENIIDDETNALEDKHYFPSLLPRHIIAGFKHMGEGTTNAFPELFQQTKSNKTLPHNLIKQQICPINLSNPRILALLDLPESQIAILLSVKRILYRQSQTTKGYNMNSDCNGINLTANNITKNNDGKVSLNSNNRHMKKKQPLITFHQVSEEYINTFAKKHPKHFSSRSLLQAFLHLLDTDLIRPALDCHGVLGVNSSRAQSIPYGGALQYKYSSKWTTCPNIVLVEKMPIHVTIEMEREFDSALKGGWLDCSTVLKDWGLKITAN